MSTPSPDDVRRACVALGARFGKNIKYAIVGGAACQLLGSTRMTEDVDFVVPQGKVSEARLLLAADKDSFTVEPRTRWTFYKSIPTAVEIEILSPPGTFKEIFNADTPTLALTVDGMSVEILHPLSILNAKCRSILGRASDDKKKTDAVDIRFLLRWIAENQMTPTAHSVPNVTEDFVVWFNSIYDAEEFWTAAGFNQKTGEFWITEWQCPKLNILDEQVRSEVFALDANVGAARSGKSRRMFVCFVLVFLELFFFGTVSIVSLRT